MLRKKIYIPIGLCLFLLLAIGFLSLRSDVPDEPIVIYKTVTPIKRSVPPMTPTSEVRTPSASMPIEETTTAFENTGLSEELLSEILSKYPDYETMDAWNQENVRRWVSKDRIIRAQEAELVSLRKKVADTQEIEAVASYVTTLGNRIISDYPDVLHFLEKHPFPFTTNDILYEYPDTAERMVFLKRFLEYDDLRIKISDSILNSPAMMAELSSDELEKITMPSIRNSIDPKIREYIENWRQP